MKRRFFVAVLGALSLVALGLASVSIYSTVGLLCGQRRREYFIRMALGAERIQIAGLLFQMVYGLVKTGVGLGLIFAALGSMAFTDMLFETSPIDVSTFAVATSVLVMAILLASGVHFKMIINNDIGRQLRST
jgi:putative ABC transport system permease protein